MGPNGALEDEIVASMAHLLWRRKNLATFRVAKLAQRRMMKSETAWYRRWVCRNRSLLSSKGLSSKNGMPQKAKRVDELGELLRFGGNGRRGNTRSHDEGIGGL